MISQAYKRHFLTFPPAGNASLRLPEQGGLQGRLDAEAPPSHH